MEDALLLAHMRCDANCSAATSVAHAINRFWSGLGLDARRALTSEKKHVVLQSLRKKHLHTRNCPCCQHSKVRTHLHPRPTHITIIVFFSNTCGRIVDISLPFS
jgi:hypothetical protein